MFLYTYFTIDNLGSRVRFCGGQTSGGLGIREYPPCIRGVPGVYPRKSDRSTRPILMAALVAAQWTVDLTTPYKWTVDHRRYSVFIASSRWVFFGATSSRPASLNPYVLFVEPCTQVRALHSELDEDRSTR